ncbi:Fucose 4-O-acetylase [Bacteroides thetaiotaomicron]|nr:Fucose 4-O-acetylase [Bacteroides thetaiotaomicron]
MSLGRSGGLRMTNNRNLDEISLIRPILIVLLVLYHAFCPWTGAWETFCGFEENDVYRWIADFSYSFMLPTFVVVSGYVWAFQREELQRKEGLSTLFSKKFRRLMIPCIIFSFVYSLIFGITQNGESPRINDYISLLVNGAGHLWFLPMLMSCFIICWTIIRLTIRWRFKFLLAFVFSFFGFLKLPFMAGSALYYSFFMLLGYWLFLNKNQEKMKLSYGVLVGMSISFILVFIVVSILINEVIIPQYQISTLLQKCGLLAVMTILRLLYSSLGVISVFCFSFIYIQSNAIGPGMIRFGSSCMGVYIFQQFVLKIIYYKTDLPVALGNSTLPLISFTLAMIISYFLTVVFRTTKIGKKVL